MQIGAPEVKIKKGELAQPHARSGWPLSRLNYLEGQMKGDYFMGDAVSYADFGVYAVLGAKLRKSFSVEALVIRL